MIAYGIVDKDGSIAVDPDGKLLLFKLKRVAKRIRLYEGEKIQKLEVRNPLDGR